MFNLVQFVENHSSSREIDQKKEKFAEENHDYPVASQDISSQPSVLGEKDKGVSMTKIPSEQKPIATKEQNEPLALAAPVSGKEAVTDLSHNPSVGRNQSVPKPLKPQTITRIPRPFSKIAYKRNTGIEDNNLLPYTNTEDTELLAKLGYSVDKDLYLFLPRGEEKEDLYSYVEKVAGVSKDVARCIDQGTAFSSEHLKDMSYEVPEGYEIKGDLVCPIEKKAELIKQAIYDNIVIENPKGSKKEFGKNYPIPVMTYPVDYGYLPGYMAQDDADLDFFKGSDASKGFHGSFDVWRPDVKGELETKFYTSANEEEKKAILEAFKKVIRGTPKEYDNAALLDAINSFKVKTAAADPAQTILITGHSGSGKSTLGKLLAEKLNLPLHRVDAQQSWDDLRANLEAAPDYERKALTPGTLENKKYIRDIRKIVRKSLGEIDGPAILEGTQVTTLPDKQLKKYMANILVGGDVNQSIAQRLERMSDKAAKKGINFSPEQIEKKKLESKLVAESWSPGINKFRQMPGVLKYNHTEHKPEALIDQLRVLMNKKANALVVSGIHGDEPAGDKAAQKLKDSADVVSHVNPSDNRRFEGKDINRHFDKPTEGKVQKTILDIIRKKKPSKVIALHEDDEVDKPYAYSSESLKDETREALKDHSTASSAHGDKAEDGVISKGKNPPDGSLEKALDDRDIPRVTLETPSKAQDIDKRVKTQLDVVKKLLGKKADINNTPNNQATVADPYSGIAGDAAVNAGEAAAIYGANSLSGKFKERIFTKADKFPGVGPLLQKANLWKNVAKYVPAGGAAAQAYGAVDRFKNKDYIGSAIDGVGAAGSAAQIIPHPVAKGVGLGVSTASTAINAARDIHKYNNRPVEFRNTPPQLPDQPAAPVNELPPQLAKQGEATHELKSSNIKAVGYSKENKKLEVAFHSGGNYTYNDVPKSLFDRIKRVKSPGKFFHKHIKKDNKFEYNKLEKESSVLSSHPGTVTNLEAYQPPEMSKMDIIGSLLLGENYIPQRREYESIYESTQRSKRNTDYITHHPLLTDNMSKNLSNVFGGDVNKAYKDVTHMLSNPEVMSQFKQAESIFDRLEKKIYLEMQNER